MAKKKKSGHGKCCASRKRPKRQADFVALNYPSNPTGGHGGDVKNRVRNPENVPVTYAEPHHKNTRKRWYIRIKGTPHLLDGSGNQISRGRVLGYAHDSPDPNPAVRPKLAGDRVICLNAANLKQLPLPGGTKLHTCGFTWNAPLTDGSKASGWMPLSALTFKKNRTKNKKKILDTLRQWACCKRKYETWAKAFIKKKPKPKACRIRTVKELLGAFRACGKNDTTLARHFKRAKKKPPAGVESLRAVLKRLAPEPNDDLLRDKVYKALGILATANANKLMDYLPKDGRDASGGEFANLSANISINKLGRPRMAPIGIDVLPVGHKFYKVALKKKVWGPIYAGGVAGGAVIGQVQWVYGYAVVLPKAQKMWKKGDKDKNAKKQRRWGWYPSIALKS